jgi:hypothetical protein
MQLANALLKEGRVQPVKQYLRDIGSFWKMDDGRIAEWSASIEKGERPELNRFPPRVHGLDVALMALYLAWPLMVAGGFLYFLRHRISKKWLFAVTSVVSGYVAMMIVGWSSPFVLPMIVGSMETPNFFLVMTTLILATAAGFVASLLAVFGISRMFVAPKAPVEPTP